MNERHHAYCNSGGLRRHSYVFWLKSVFDPSLTNFPAGVLSVNGILHGQITWQHNGESGHGR